MSRNYLLSSAVFLLAAGLVAYFVLHTGTIPVLAPQGPVAFGERQVMIITLLLCSIIVLPLFALLFFIVWKYRAERPQAQATHLPEWDHGTRAAEIIWWLVPTIIVAVLAVVAWQSSHALDPYKPLASATPPLEVEVVALDWKWLFIYPSLGIASVNMLEIPEGTPVHFSLTADAPMNSFWIPSLGGQIMVMPGMETQLSLMASNAGTFDGLSGNLSGKGFAGMTFATHAVSPAEFQLWVQSVQNASSTPLTSSTYATLAEPSEYTPAAQYAPVDASLYTGVIEKYMEPGTMGMSMQM